MSGVNGLRVAWLVLPRTGSEFLVRLTKSLFDDLLHPQSSLTPGRKEKALPPDLLAEQEREGAFHRYLAAGRPERYFEDLGVRSVKIETPFGDDLADRIAASHPECRFVASIRSFRGVAESHASLSWGLSPDRLLATYRQHAAAITAFARLRRVFFVDIDRQVPLDATDFAAFLGVAPSARFLQMQAAWPLVNSRAYRIARDGAAEGTPQRPDARIEAEGEAVDATLRAFAAANNAQLRARAGA